MSMIDIDRLTGLTVANFNEYMALAGILCGFTLTLTLILFINNIK